MSEDLFKKTYTFLFSFVMLWVSLCNTKLIVANIKKKFARIFFYLKILGENIKLICLIFY